jgi:RNA polymerase sigma-70 factor (ECF subfamily)
MRHDRFDKQGRHIRENGHVNVSNDEDAILCCQRGDIEGLATLIRRYQADALRLAYLLCGDRYLAEDITQDSFIQAYHTMSRFQPGRPFRPWFHQIVTNTARMRLRSASRRRETSMAALLSDETRSAGGLPDGSRDESNPATRAERMEDRTAIGRALALLTPKQREALALRYYLDYRDDEIAAILGCGVNTARHRVYDGLGALERVLRQRFPWLLQDIASDPAIRPDTTTTTAKERRTS